MTAARFARALLALTAVLVAVMVWASAGREPAIDTVLYGVLALAFAGTGALVVARHPAHRLGWTFMAMGLLTGVWEAFEGWGHLGREEGTAGGPIGEWVILWSWIVDMGLLALVFLTFPDGRLPGPRWRLAVGLVVAAVGVCWTGQALNPELGSEFAAGENPVGVEALPTGALLAAGYVLVVGALASGVAALVVRFRRGSWVERQQLKWFALAASFVLVAVVAAAFWWYDSVVVQGGIVVSLMGVPIASGIAILRHGLYDIDLVIRRTLVYGVLTATLGAAYAATVLVLQLVLSPGADVAVAASTLAVAALVRPARARIQESVDRRFYRRAHDARQIVQAFASRLRDEVTLDGLDRELQDAVQRTLAPAHVSLWVRP